MTTTTTPTATLMDPVQQFVDAICSASITTADCWTPDVMLDATVPNWHFERSGIDDVRAEYAGWFAHEGHIDTLRRWPIPTGSVIEYWLHWEEVGIPHAAHHVHILEVMGDRIAHDTVMCGGRWPASLLAEIEAARG